MSIASSVTESINSHFDMFGSREKPIQTTNPYDTCDVTMLGENATIPSLSGMKIPICYANGKMPRCENRGGDCGSRSPWSCLIYQNGIQTLRT